MSTTDRDTFAATIERLFDKGVRYSTVIDAGCSDGHFFLNCLRYFPGAVPLNIDANLLYEDSLKTIQAVVGGHHRIAAVTDFVGEIEINESVHPYWSSVRRPGDLYWSRLNDLVTTKVTVPAVTLDALAEELRLKPPFLIKLDIQGAETTALNGARRVLQDAHVVIVEADIDDFRGINEILVGAGFCLCDLTNVSRVPDGSLGWFYPVYINNKLGDLLPRAFWDARENDAVIRGQIERRQYILKTNAEILNRLRFARQNVKRNDPCPCGSGKRFKHCCGAYGAA